GPQGDDDGVVAAALLHPDRGDAGKGIGGGGDVGGIHAESGKVLAGVIAKDVLAEFGDNGDVAAQLGGHHGLVGAFAAKPHMEPSAGDGFAQLGQARGVADEVDIGSANHTNLGPGHSSIHVSRVKLGS